MRARFFLSTYETTRFTQMLSAALPKTAINPGTVQMEGGFVIHLGPLGPFIETDEYPFDYPAWIDEAAVWRVSLTSTSGTCLCGPGLFQRPDGGQACLAVRHSPAGTGYFELAVVGPNLQQVKHIHDAICGGADIVEQWRTAAWDVTR